MDFSDVSLVALRVFREVAERGTFTAAASALGYTQSAVSRQIASIERAAQAQLLERRREGVRLTPAGQLVLRNAVRVLDQIDATTRELAGLPAEGGTVRLGWFPTAGAVLLPRAIGLLRRAPVTLISREGRTPTLIRSLRAGTIDLAILASVPPFRAPDAETPALMLETLAERPLRLALPAGHPLAAADSVAVEDLRGQRWIAGGSDNLLGVWPGLDERPEIAHIARDWLARLHLVAAGAGLTTVPASLDGAVPPGVRVVSVRGGPQEIRRVVLARLPGPLPESTALVADAIRAAART
ncbi:LysR family transcriptional regulator [Kribbella sancticallisti]|uniref:LysR family transcriptional regulator n=1 Tax=Kribbella sancticallisti TaxID=460087 RepID=A0ABP4N8V4_9ACTN